MFIKPARRRPEMDPALPPYLSIHDPERQDYLPKEGREVTPSEYWTRAIERGDVKEADPPAEPPAEAAAPPTHTSARPSAAPGPKE